MVKRLHMNTRIFVYSFLIAQFLTGCQAPVQNTGKGLADLRVSTEYAAPRFDTPERPQLIARALSDAHRYYRECARDHNLPGVAYGLVVDDSLVFSGGFGVLRTESGEAVTTQSLFRIASMSKSFTAMAILKLRDEGRLSLSDPLVRYLPALANLSYPTADATPVTLYDLLTMTAGFPEDNPWGDRFLDITPEDLLDQVSRGIPFSTVPSLQYEYSNLGYGLLGQVVSTVSGIPFQEYIRRNILEPLGMYHTVWEYTEVPEEQLALGYRWRDGQWIPEPMLHDGAFGAMGGLITSIEDFSRYVSLHLSAWPPRDDPDTGPVKRSTLREMHRINHPEFYYGDPIRFGGRAQPLIRGYGFGLRALQDQAGILEVGHNGGLPGFGSSYMFYPEYGIGIMAFSNLTYVGGPVQSANYRVIESLVRQDLFNPRSPAVSPLLTLRKKQVAQLLLHWDPELEKDLVAANLYLDISRADRMAEARELLEKAGTVIGVGPVMPENQLRGSFTIEGSKASIRVFFTLSPEPEPRVQWISLDLVPAGP